jgi:transcriptional regulator GlxA family with amidase domain
MVGRSSRSIDWCRTGLIHQAPEKQWTAPALSAAVGLSRSPFAAKFMALVGQPPMRYLKRWRLQLAATLLRQQPVAVSGVAIHASSVYSQAGTGTAARSLQMQPSPSR